MPNHHHRAGSLKQSNKRNKRSKASKRSISRAAGGKVEGRVGFKQRLVSHTKADRRHKQEQKRNAKKEELIRRKRGLDGGPAPPRVVGIVSLGEGEDIEDRLKELILGQADRLFKPRGDDDSSTVTARFEAHKKDGNLTILTNSSAFRFHYSSESSVDAAVLAALDLCRVCNTILFVVDGNGSRPEDNVVGISIGGDDPSTSTSKTNSSSQNYDHLISERGDRILTAVKAQGLPRALTILARTEKDKVYGDDHMTTQSAKSVRRSNLKRKAELKKYVSRFATTEFGIDNDKVLEVDLTETTDDDDMEQDNTPSEANSNPEEHVKRTLASALIRTMCTISSSTSKWVAESPRPYLLSDSHKYIPEKQELQVTGYVRGIVPFDLNSLVHIPNLGTFECKSLSEATSPFTRNGTDKERKTLDTIVPDPENRESLDMFAAPDALEGEQNLVGFDEDDQLDDQEADEGSSDKFARPVGWSDYQSAWLDAVDEVGIAEEEMDHGELAKELNKKHAEPEATADSMDLDDANQVSEKERQALLEQRRKEQHEHLEFPDEVQVKDDEKARDRFARYRSLKSFRKSHWDPKENLPESYSSIYHFASFKATQRSVMTEMRDLSKAASACNGNFWDGERKGEGVDKDLSMEADSDDDDDILKECVPSGSYVTLTIAGVNSKNYSEIDPDSLLAVVALLPHENKVSVLHMGLSQSSGFEMNADDPVKSKDVLIFRCGWRSWTGRPVFSQNNLNCDKHKFERFLPQAGSFFAASVFGPVTYTPCPVLVFREREGQKELVATGSMIGADAERIVVKRIILTGYPVRVHKRFATVKYMFYDPEDVKWFKPAGLTTKHGLNGNIEESVGEHGTMKCLFNAPIKQHDTVCLPLYKRIFPKFAVKETAADDMGTIRSTRAPSTLLVR